MRFCDGDLARSEIFRKTMAIAADKLNQREIGPHKAVVAPLLGSRTVLTNSPWTFAALWLRRNRKPEALFYWEQAQEFHQVSVGLPLRSAPLLLYYCFMNAAKALLAAKSVSFNEMHGTSAHPKVVTGAKRTFAGEGIKIHAKGLLPSFSTYYGEVEPSKPHTLKEFFFNMVFIHRPYCLPYSSQKKMFLPLAACGYVYDTRTKEVFFKADIEKNIPFNRAVKKLPATFAAAPLIGPRAIRSVAALIWRTPGQPTATNIQELVEFNRIAPPSTALRDASAGWRHRRMTDHTPISQVSRLEVISLGSRRRWSLAEKQRIVAECYSLSLVLSATARREGLSVCQYCTLIRAALYSC